MFVILFAHLTHDGGKPPPTRHGHKIPVEPLRHTPLDHLLHALPPPLRIPPPAHDLGVWVDLAQLLDEVRPRRVSDRREAPRGLSQRLQEPRPVVLRLVDGKPFLYVSFARLFFVSKKRKSSCGA